MTRTPGTKDDLYLGAFIGIMLGFVVLVIGLLVWWVVKPLGGVEPMSAPHYSALYNSPIPDEDEAKLEAMLDEQRVFMQDCISNNSEARCLELWKWGRP